MADFSPGLVLGSISPPIMGEAHTTPGGEILPKTRPGEKSAMSRTPGSLTGFYRDRVCSPKAVNPTASLYVKWEKHEGVMFNVW